MADLSTEIETAATSPKRVSGDAGSVEARDISELIEAEKHLSSKEAATKKGWGIGFRKLTPPGAV